MILKNSLTLPCSFLEVQQHLSGIEAIDYFFAKEIISALVTPLIVEQLNDEQQTQLFYLFMVLSAHVRAGHSCLPVHAIAEQCWGSARDENGQATHSGFYFSNFASVQQLLSLLAIDVNDQAILVFEHNKLYMRRYYLFETELARSINARLTAVAPALMRNIVDCMNVLFPQQAKLHQEIDWQQLAVANAMNKNFSVIAGGPGTGKTYTVTKLLAALIMLAKKEQHADKLSIALVAPTGKAAQRLTESITNTIAGFAGIIDEEVLADIPTNAQTIHRLLGVIPNSPNFRHNQANLLHYDVLLVDEVSMVDLPMMARIFRALKPTTKVILLGDADQLPSVAVGSVLADIAPSPHRGYSKSNYQYLVQACQVNETQLINSFTHVAEHRCDHLSFLIKSRRFDGQGGIGKLASSVIQGNVEQSWLLLSQKKDNLVGNHSQLSLEKGELKSWLTPLVKQYYQGISACNSLEQAFELLAKFRVLCVTRQGEYGVVAINQWIQALFNSNALSSSGKHYHGMPIMISENDYRLGLFNGDIGLLWSVKSTSDQHQCNQLMAFFEQGVSLKNASKVGVQCQDKHAMADYKSFLPSRLPKFEPVYAMTIHKTQGSEFDHVAMVLPKGDSPLLSRELLYTAITRAKELLTVSTNQYAWQQGVTKAVKRYSGLKLI